MKLGRPSKGERSRVTVRVPPQILQELQALQVAHGLDGISEVIEEVVRLRQDRDQGLAQARQEARESRQHAANLLREITRLQGENRRLRSTLKKHNPRAALKIPPVDVQASRVVPACLCGSPVTVEDVALGHSDCAPCRGRRIAALMAGQVETSST